MSITENARTFKLFLETWFMFPFPLIIVIDVVLQTLEVEKNCEILKNAKLNFHDLFLYLFPQLIYYAPQ